MNELINNLFISFFAKCRVNQQKAQNDRQEKFINWTDCTKTNKLMK